MFTALLGRIVLLKLMLIKPNLLLVDLNNFARYPSLSIGYLTAVLRQASAEVTVFAPLMVGVTGVIREKRPHYFSLIMAKLNHIAATSRSPRVRRYREHFAKRRWSGITANHRVVIDGFKNHLTRTKPQVVMISTYLMYRDVCNEICALCHEAGIKVIIGGPYFSQPKVIAEWVSIPGLSALIAGEVELNLPAIVRTVLDAGDVSVHAGVFVADDTGRNRGRVASPLQELDAVPFPDYSDFPWKSYPNRIVPIITGRGCGWGACSFCSDVTSSAGRTFRSRTQENVLRELSQHHRLHDASLFAFTDLKLNSSVDMWRSIISGIQTAVPGAQWIAAVHVGTEDDNGLSDADLTRAAKSGCVRLTTGLESGSQRVVDLMKKGTNLSAINSFLQRAALVGISCRCTMILGYPGETAQDVHDSADFLSKHTRQIERVSLSRLQVIAGTTLHQSLERSPQKFKGFSIVRHQDAMAQIEHDNHTIATASHRKAVMRLLGEVHRINRRPLSSGALEFEGVM